MSTQVALQNSGGDIFTGVIAPGPLFIREFAFTFATVGLTTGVPILQLRAGDVVYDVGFGIPTAFDGTTPLADVGTFTGGNDGLFQEFVSTPIDLTAADNAVTDNTELLAPANPNWLQAAVGSAGAAGGAAYNASQLAVATDCELLLVVSETGAKGSTATGSTAGAGVVYVVTSTPG